MLKKISFISLVVLVLLCLVSPVFGQHVWKVNSQGQITLDGQRFRVKGGSWFGLNGRYEYVTDANNPAGAPMEQYMGNVFWAVTNRTYASDCDEFKSMGFNVIRLPLVPQTFDNNDPQGKDPLLKNAAQVRIQGARNALEYIIKALNTAGLFVVLDIHSCSNYVGWRAGRLDARPPYADASWDQYPYMRGDCSCSATGNPSTVTRIQAYDTSKWLDNLKTLSGYSSTLNVNNIMGIDIFNEPWDYSWAEWKSLIEQAYGAINSVNPNILIFAQGVGSTNGSQDGSPGTINQTPHGDHGLPNWGENLYEAGANPPNIPKERLVFSPHCYGPSMITQPMFADPNQPECATLQEDAFGNAKCQIVIDPSRLELSWEEHFGYLKDLGYAICIGEFGGNMDWPARAEARIQSRYSYLTNRQADLQWQTAFVNYLVKRGILDTIYWAINPESTDVGGMYTTPYEPTSNTGGWGTWGAPDTRKLNLLKKLWIMDPTWDPPPTPTQSPTPTPTNFRRGDANDNGVVDIIDALWIAQKTAGLNPTPFNAAQADVNCDGVVNIVDALFIARYSAGVSSVLNCN